MRVSEAMTRDVVTATPDTPVGDLVQRLALVRVSGCPVVDETGEVVGVVSESDILRTLRTHLTTQLEFVLPTPFDLVEYPLRAALQRRELEQSVQAARNVRVGDIMTRELVTCAPSELLADVSERMLARDVNRVPVIENGRLVGIITRGDIVRALARQAARGGEARPYRT